MKGILNDPYLETCKVCSKRQSLVEGKCIAGNIDRGGVRPLARAHVYNSPPMTVRNMSRHVKYCFQCFFSFVGFYWTTVRSLSALEENEVRKALNDWQSGNFLKGTSMTGNGEEEKADIGEFTRVFEPIKLFERKTLYSLSMLAQHFMGSGNNHVLPPSELLPLVYYLKAATLPSGPLCLWQCLIMGWD